MARPTGPRARRCSERFTSTSGGPSEPSDGDYAALLAFRDGLRRFLRFSEDRAVQNGLVHIASCVGHLPTASRSRSSRLSTLP